MVEHERQGRVPHRALRNRETRQANKLMNEKMLSDGHGGAPKESGTGPRERECSLGRVLRDAFPGGDTGADACVNEG